VKVRLNRNITVRSVVTFVINVPHDNSINYNFIDKIDIIDDSQSKNVSHEIINVKDSSDEEVVWQPSESVTSCSFCSAPFTVFFRKHHCRRCGFVVCDNCSTSRIRLPINITASKDKFNTSSKNDILSSPVRVCDGCVNSQHLTFR
jgi:hypothetical protein